MRSLIVPSLRLTKKPPVRAERTAGGHYTFSRRAAMQGTQTAYADAKKCLKSAIRATRCWRIVWSDLAPGAYIYATMRRTASMR